MMRIRLFKYALVGICLALSPSMQGILACSCSWVGEGFPSLGVYEAVFQGKVISIRDITIPLDREPKSFRRMKLVVFEVQTSWKGPRLPSLSLYTGCGGGDCGFQFIQEAEYVVFARRIGPDARALLHEEKYALTTDICTSTALASEANELIKGLDSRSSRWTPIWLGK